MDFVAHICRNKDCNNIFVAEDYTKVKDIPPKWRWCPDCCKELGIDYAAQTPKKNRTPEEQKKINEQTERIKKYQFKKTK